MLLIPAPEGQPQVQRSSCAECRHVMLVAARFCARSLPITQAHESLRQMRGFVSLPQPVLELPRDLE